MNYFDHDSVAERYARDRPNFHPTAVERIRAYLRLERPVAVALDAGCGTGMSSVALTEIAESVIGIDPSPAMLSQAPAHPRIRFLEAAAERMPVADQSMDLVTAMLAYHWFDRTRFLGEAHRVLRPGGVLAVVSHGMRSWLMNNPALVEWFKTHYFPRYPAPPRNAEPLTNEIAREHSFAFLGQEKYGREWQFSPEQIARNLLTHSNVIAAVEGGRESLGEIYEWIVESMRPLFSAPTEAFVFTGEIWYLRRESL